VPPLDVPVESLTPKERGVLLIDGNARAMSDDEIVRFARDNNVGLVGISAMARGGRYRVADALRAWAYRW
jgi:hypothetical protein